MLTGPDSRPAPPFATLWLPRPNQGAKRMTEFETAMIDELKAIREATERGATATEAMLKLLHRQMTAQDQTIQSSAFLDEVLSRPLKR